MRNDLLILVVCLTAAILAAGCCGSSSSSSYATSAPTASSNVVAQTTAASGSGNSAQFASAVSASVMTMKKNWDSDADDDGIVVFPDIKDAAGETVKCSGATLPVSVEVWTTKMDSNFKEQKDQLVFQGSGTIDSWEDGNFLLGQGIRIPFDQMNVPAGETFGWTYAKIQTPDGKTYEGVEKFTSLTA